LARHRSAFRDVVKEGLLKACRVKVSIPFSRRQFQKTKRAACVTCLFGENGVGIGGVTAIHLYLLEMRISFWIRQQSDHASDVQSILTMRQQVDLLQVRRESVHESRNLRKFRCIPKQEFYRKPVTRYVPEPVSSAEEIDDLGLESDILKSSFFQTCH